MYDYRKMTNDERARVMEYRRLRNLPLHSPPHWAMGFSAQYLVTAACFEHAPIIGESPERLTECEEQMLSACEQHASKIYAWSVLPNHYHVLLGSRRIKSLCRALGRFHGRSSFNWNGEDGQRGRKVWFRCFDREIRSERHFWATLNYIHHNPVHHRHVEKWQDWIWSSAAKFLEGVGRERAAPRFGETIQFWITVKAGTSKYSAHVWSSAFRRQFGDSEVWSSAFRRRQPYPNIPPKGGTPN